MFWQHIPPIWINHFWAQTYQFCVLEIVDWLAEWFAFVAAHFTFRQLNKTRNEAQIFTAKIIITTTITIKYDVCKVCGVNFIASRVFISKMSRKFTRTHGKRKYRKRSQKSAQSNQRNEGKTPKTIANSHTKWNAAINIGHKPNQIKSKRPMDDVCQCYQLPLHFAYMAVCVLSPYSPYKTLTEPHMNRCRRRRRQCFILWTWAHTHKL